MTAISNGGAAQRVKVLTDADLKANGGQYALEGRPPVAVYGVTDAETVAQGGQFVVMGNVAQPVYVVDAPDGAIEATIAPTPMIAVEGGLALGGSAIPVYVVGGSLGGGLDPVSNLTLEVTGADFDVITVTWDAVTGATEYDVEYSPDGVTYAPVDTTPLLTYDITDSDYDVDVAIHYVRVRASNGSVDSDWVVVEVDGWKINVGFYLKLDETSGNRTDTVQGLILTDNNTVGSTTGIISNAARFIKANSKFFSTPDNAALNIGGDDFTIRLWVRVLNSGTSGEYQALFGKGTGPTNEYNLLCVNDGETQFNFTIYDSTGSAGAVTSAVLSDNVWYRVVITRVSDKMYMYINNNAPTDTTLFTTPNASSTSQLTIGQAEFYGGLYTWGDLDEFAICKGRAWSAAQMTQDWNSGAGRTY